MTMTHLPFGDLGMVNIPAIKMGGFGDGKHSIGLPVSAGHPSSSLPGLVEPASPHGSVGHQQLAQCEMAMPHTTCEAKEMMVW